MKKSDLSSLLPRYYKPLAIPDPGQPALSLSPTKTSLACSCCVFGTAEYACSNCIRRVCGACLCRCECERVVCPYDLNEAGLCRYCE
jgi:hypothetical protein